jgi:monooxygenase
MQETSWIDFTSGYVQRSVDKFPKQGSKNPWRSHQNYMLDILTLRNGALEDGTLIFSD